MTTGLPNAFLIIVNGVKKIFYLYAQTQTKWLINQFFLFNSAFSKTLRIKLTKLSSVHDVILRFHTLVKIVILVKLIILRV